MAVKNFVEEMKKWGSMKQNGVRQMKNFWGHFSSKNLLIPVQFVHEELLPIRIARGVLELEDCPYGLSKELGVVKVPDLHLDSFHVLQSYPEIKDKNDEFKFTKMVKTITLRHNNVVPMMALGVKQLKKEQPQFSYEDLGKIQQLLDRFYMSKGNTCPYMMLIHFPILWAIYMQKCLPWRLHAMPVRMPREFAYMNMAAVQLKLKFTDILILHSLQLRICWTRNSQQLMCTMAGYGHGGDLQTISMEGYGTDAYLHFSRLGDKEEEPLP